MKSAFFADDGAVIRRCLDGDRDSYSILVDRYKSMIFTVAFRMTGDGDIAEDLAQETFIAAYNGLGRFRFDAKFSSWLYSIVLNKCRDHLKRTKELVSDEEIAETMPARGHSPEHAAAAHQSTDMLQQALNALPLDYRQVLILKHIEELDYQEIADITGANIPALKVRAHRGREMLKQILEEAGVNHG